MKCHLRYSTYNVEFAYFQFEFNLAERDYVPVVLFSLFVQIITFMALIISAHKATDGKDIGIIESYRLSSNYFVQFVWTGFLYLLIVIIGLIAFIIPGIVFGIRYAFAPYLSIVDDINAKEAFSRSKIMTKNRLLAIGWREFVFGLLFSLVILIPVYVFTTVLTFLIGGFEIFHMSAKAISTFGDIVWQGLFVILNVLLLKSLREDLFRRDK